MATLTDVFAEDMIWHEPGRNLISGHHRGRAAVFAAFAKAAELTGNSLRLEVRDILANDTRAVALLRERATRRDKSKSL